jgi:hypothetical protein
MAIAFVHQYLRDAGLGAGQASGEPIRGAPSDDSHTSRPAREAAR